MNERTLARRLWLPLALAVLVGVCGLTAAPAAAAETKPAARKFEVEKVRDLAYYEGEGADKDKHKLDLYLPKGHKDFPVLFFVHGGAWMMGDRNYFGVYGALGTLFARHGIGTVVISYRLSPAVQHPEHIKDVARAFAWTHKNIGKYGGKPDHIFCCGHSAGGHLVSLLSTDESYLKAEGLSLKAVKGTAPISGVYEIGTNLLPTVFGRDPEVCKLAGPIHHCKEDCPPFLIIYAEKELLNLGQMAEDFYKALKDKKCPAEIIQVKKRNHMSIIVSASVEDDPATEAILKFIATHVTK
jgi:acetyl esterase/lipase